MRGERGTGVRLALQRTLQSWLMLLLPYKLQSMQQSWHDIVFASTSKNFIVLRDIETKISEHVMLHKTVDGANVFQQPKLV
jgi:hypothetical protein